MGAPLDAWPEEDGGSLGSKCPGVLHVSAAGWERANGIYFPIAEQHGGKVYENSSRFLISREQGIGGKLAWVLGVGRQPLYVVPSAIAAGPPRIGWRPVPDWGRDPVPLVRGALDVTQALLTVAREQLPGAAAALAREDWASAGEAWRTALDHLAHLLDNEQPEVVGLLAQLHGELDRLPLRQARAAKRDADKACRDGDWEQGLLLHDQALSCLAHSRNAGNAEDEIQELREKLEAGRRALPLRRLAHAQLEVRAAVEQGDWEEVGNGLEMVAYCAREAESAGFAVDDAQMELESVRRSLVLHRAGTARSRGEAAVREGAFAEADRHFAASLRTLESLKGQGDSHVLALTKEVQDSRGAAATARVDLLLREVAALADADDWAGVDERLDTAQRSLRPCISHTEQVTAVNLRLQEVLRSTAEKKIALARRMGNEAADAQDWGEADACWAEALALLDANGHMRWAAADIREQLICARCEVANIVAGDLLREGDECRQKGNIFDADDLYTEAIQRLSTHRAGVEPLRCKLLARRAEILHRKWQHQEAADDCSHVLENSDDKEEKVTAALLGADACRAQHEKIVKETNADLLEVGRFNWMDPMQRACQFLEEAVQLEPENYELRRKLRAWRRETPPRPQPFREGPPLDWSKVPKNDKANFFGHVNRRASFSSREIEEIWSKIPKESKEEDDMSGQHIGRKTFYRVVHHLSGEVEQEEFEKLWEDADEDEDGLLSFQEFARIMRFDERTKRD